MWDIWPVRRAAMVVLLTLLTFDVSGLAAICGDSGRDESCPADASGGQCPPNCHDCNCCSLPTVIGSAPLTLVVPAPQRASVLLSPTGPQSPEPADILHVPKTLA